MTAATAPFAWAIRLWWILTLFAPEFEVVQSGAAPWHTPIERWASCLVADADSDWLTSWIVTPSWPRVTLPVFRICLSTLSATSIGIANETPCEPPERL